MLAGPLMTVRIQPYPHLLHAFKSLGSRQGFVAAELQEPDVIT